MAIVSNTADDAELQTIGTLLERVAPEDHALVERAWAMAKGLHSSQVRSSGEPYISHPLAVAHLVADIKLDAYSIAAAILHDVLEDTDVTRADLLEQFPADMVRIIEGVTKIGRIHFSSKNDAQTENYRKLFLAMAADTRVVMVKLCDRLHNMRTLKHLPEDRRIRISRETLELFAPLAGRLGLSAFKVEFEDSAMRWLYPEDYKELTGLFSTKRAEREERVNHRVQILYERLRPRCPTIEIYGRSKHFYSIWKKMKLLGLSFDEIYDLSAVRIICEKTEECYAIMGEVHSLWRPVPGKIKDYIAVPKKNGYRSLHTTVINSDGETTEVQIRTRDMHNEAEYGIAAHWMYKETGRRERITRIEQSKRDLTQIREIIESLMEEREPGAFLDALKKEIIDDVVIVFSPKGDVYELPKESTPIDFAFLVHTEVGLHCTGAKVNRRMANLRSVLQNGDTVEIVTSPHGHPSRDWEKFARTSKARTKIKQYFKSQNFQLYVTQGQDEIRRVMDEHDITAKKVDLDSGLEKVAKEMRFEGGEDLLAEIGYGATSASAVLSRLYPDSFQKQLRRAGPRKPKKKDQSPVSIPGMEGDLSQVRFASCCHPVYGERIVAFVTRGRGITLHRSNCPTIQRHQETAGDGGRYIPADWNVDGDSFRLVPIRIEAEDRANLLHDITSAVSRHDLYIETVNNRANQETGMTWLRLTIKVDNAAKLERLLVDLRSVKGVLSAERSSRSV